MPLWEKDELSERCRIHQNELSLLSKNPGPWHIGFFKTEIL